MCDRSLQDLTMYPDLKAALDQVEATVYAIVGNREHAIGQQLRNILSTAKPHELHYLISALADELDPPGAEDVTMFESLPNAGNCEI